MALLVGVLVALAAVALVLDPIIRPAVRQPAPPAFSSEDEDDPVLQRKELALAALKEIEFDRATGKLSEADYETLHARYTEEALAALRAEDAVATVAAGAPGRPAPGGSIANDAVERLIESARLAARGQKFCTECGTVLEGSGKFCVECGAGQGVVAKS